MCEETPLIAASVLVTRCSQVNPTLPMETLLWCVWEGVCVCEWVRVCVWGGGGYHYITQVSTEKLIHTHTTL